MLERITINTQSSIRIESDKIIYFDPFKISKETHDADYIFVTHDHYDHLDIDSIKNIMNENTTIIIPDSIFLKVVPYIDSKQVKGVNPNEEYKIGELSFKTIPSYNIGKIFHPRKNNYVGYLLNLEDKVILVAGDTDKTPELLDVKCDIALVPIGGTYTMNPKEAAEVINHIKPTVAIPTHYGSIVGNKKDADIFANLLDSDIECIDKMGD
jgi:L-ascorbate metabolism protein UlaG (beta-lactamase superfamily)